MPRDGKTKNLVVYEKLRQQIIKGSLRPGQRLVMASLAKSFGISETPVREAIRRLESDGYVVFTPHSGAMVTMIDNRELSEIYLIRISLEALATRLAGPYINQHDLNWLKKKNLEMAEAIKKRRYDKYAILNKAFHLRIYKAAPYPRLYKMITDLWEAFDRWPSVFSYVPERAADSIREHDQIIESLAAGDLDRADTLMKKQKELALKALQNYVAQLETASAQIEKIWSLGR